MAVLPRTKDHYKIQFEKPDINGLIEETSIPMRLNRLINRLDFKEFHKKYSVVGAPSYPAEDILAVIMLAFSEGIFSSREIEKKCKRDISFQNKMIFTKCKSSSLLDLQKKLLYIYKTKTAERRDSSFIKKKLSHK